MEKINQLIQAIGSLRDEGPNSLQACKNALNNIFIPDANCVNFIYTKNTDKLPFACIVMPVIPTHIINNLIISGDPVRFKDYEIEIDSKIFDYGLTDQQVAEVMIYNIYHMVKDTTPAERFREELDAFLTENGTQIIVKDSIQYQAILAFGLLDTLVHCTNCMYADPDVYNDAYLYSLGLNDFDEALNKLFKRVPGIDNSGTRGPNMSMLKWALRLYNDVKKERIAALNVMKRCKEINASKLYDTKMDLVIAALNRIETDGLLAESAYFKEAAADGALVSQIKYSGLRSIDDDYYEYEIRSKNVTEEDEALYILRQLNVRLSLLDDYIRSDLGKNDKELDRWEKLYHKYYDLREQIAENKMINRIANHVAGHIEDKIDKHCEHHGDHHHDDRYDNDNKLRFEPEFDKSNPMIQLHRHDIKF